MANKTVKTLTQLDDLVPDPNNANKGTDRGRELLSQSLGLYGAGRSILTDRQGRIIAGHKTVQQAKKLGFAIEVIRTNGRRLVVVQREDLDLARDSAARALAVGDNRIAELDLDWDAECLARLRSSGLDLDDWWSPEEWEALVQSATIDDREEQVLKPRDTTIQRGDLFSLGPHRLLCGDATDAKDVERLVNGQEVKLMVCDPPYGIDYDPSWRHRIYPRQRNAVGKVQNDHQASWHDAFQLFRGDVLYTWHAGVRSAEVAIAIRDAGFDIRSQIIWVKSHFVLGRGAYQQGHEPAFYAVRKGGSAHWHGGRTQSTVWIVANLNPFGGSRAAEDERTGHSTQKPVRLFEIPIANHLRRDETVYDPFVGSGTTLMAAHKLGRVAYVMDLDPIYVQACIDRWEGYTGLKARQLAHGGRSR